MDSIQSKRLLGKIFPGLTLRHNIIHKIQNSLEYTRLWQVTKTKPVKQHVGETMEAEIQLSLALNPS